MKSLVAALLFLLALQVVYSQTCAAGSYLKGSTCTRCDPGTFSATSGASTCEACSEGSIAARAGATSCTTCPPGSTSSEDRKNCNKCPSGTYRDGLGSGACTTCANGKTSTAGAISCTNCPAHTYGWEGICYACNYDRASLPGTPSFAGCIKCDSGSFLSSDGNCLSCPSNTFSLDSRACVSNCIAGQNKDGSNCFFCPAGFFSTTNDSATCKPCGYGTYTSDFKSCLRCPKGTYNNIIGVSECMKCPKGMVSTIDGAFACQLCPANSIPDLTQSKCVPCPTGQIATPGSAECVRCPPGNFFETKKKSCSLCPAGTYSADGITCSACPAGSYSIPGTSSTSCIECPEGTISSTDRKSCTLCPENTMEDGTRTKCEECEAGMFSDPGSTSCTDCPAGTFRPAKSKTGCMNCNNGYFSDSANSAECKLCRPTTYTSSEPDTQATECAIQPDGKSERARSQLITCHNGDCYGAFPSLSTELIAAYKTFITLPNIRLFLLRLPLFLDSTFRMNPLQTSSGNLLKAVPKDLATSITNWGQVTWTSSSVMTAAKATIKAALTAYTSSKIPISELVRTRLGTFANTCADDVTFFVSQGKSQLAGSGWTVDITNDVRQLYTTIASGSAAGFGEWLGMFVQDALYICGGGSM